MKKLLRAALWIVLLAALAAVAGLVFFGGPLIVSTVNTAGPKLLGVPVTLADARFSPLQGRLMLERLHIGNPEGFKTESLLEVDRIEVDVDPRSLFSDTIVVRRVQVDAPRITMERGLKTSNLSALLKNLEGQPKAPPAAEPPAGPTPEKPGKKVVIDDLKVSGGQVNFSVTLAQGVSASIALAEIHLTQIGREEGMAGLGLPEVVRIILTTIIKSVLETAGNVGGAAIDGVTAVGGAAVEGVTGVGGAAAEGVTAAGGAAVEGVKKIGGGVGRAVGGWLGRDSEPPPKDPDSKP